MSDTDKVEFMEHIKQAMIREQGVPWKYIEKRMVEEIENIFDDEKFLKMNPDFRVDAAFARKEFGDQKPTLVDYMLWMVRFVTKSEYVEW